MYPFFDEDDEIPEAIRGQVDQLMAKVDNEVLHEDLDRIGVHVERAAVATRQTPDGLQAGLIITCVVGPLAFSKRVLRPEQDTIDDALADIEEGMLDEELEIRRRRLLGEPDDDA